jgi:hypothetical protein
MNKSRKRFVWLAVVVALLLAALAVVGAQIWTAIMTPVGDFNGRPYDSGGK